VRDRLAMLATIAAVAVLIPACGATTAGTDTAETSASSPAPTLPPRPREIDLTDVDTCTLLTPEQQRQLGTDRAPVASVETDRYGNTYRNYGKRASSPRFGYPAFRVLSEGGDSGRRDGVPHQ
jgi:Protein of unknown function (DUF3558)